MTKLRKFFASSVMLMTVVVMSGLTAPVATKAAASAGDLIKKDGLSAVYYLGEDGKRYVFPNEATYKSWYSDFSGVVTISADELASYPLGGNVVVRPGTKLVKITTDPKVYAVEANGTLRQIPSEAAAIALYGSDWAKRVIDVADSFFTNYTIGSALGTNEVPAGSLVKKTGDSNIYYYDGTNYRLIEDEVAFLANRFQYANVLTLSTFTAGGSTITGAEAGIIKTSQTGSTGTVITGSGITASLSSMTPASASVMATQALVPFTTINLTAANDGSVTVKSIKLKRTGISSDSSISNVYLYEGNTRLTDASSLSNGSVNFSASNLITIPAGQTKTLTVKADMASGSLSGNVGFSIASASDIVSTGASVSGSFPISGNLMSLLSAQSDLATVTLSAGASSTSPIKAGNSNMIVWSANTAVAKKAVDFKYLALKQVGSINNDDLANLSLYVDGTKVSTGVLTSNNDLVFDLTTPSRLAIGSHTIELKADIVKGSSRNFAFQMQTVANVVFTDTNYGVNIAPNTYINGTSYTISQGSVTTASDSSFTATEVVKTASNVSLGKFTMKAWGEDVKINTLDATVNFTGTSSATVVEGLNDLAIFVDGNQVGSSQTISLGLGSTTPSSTKRFGTTNLFTIPAGKTVVVEIKGSLNLDTATTSKITAIKASLGAGAGQGVTSYSTVNTNAVDGKTLTIVTGSLSVAKNGSMQNMNVSKNTKVKLGSYVLSAGSAEGVTVSNIRVGVNATSSTVLDNMSNLYISENTTPIQPQAANDFNVNLVVDKNATKVIDVWANLGDIADDLQASTTLIVTYRTNVTLTNGTTNSVDGQTITLASASLNENPTVIANTPAAGFVLGGTTGTIGNYKFVATNGNAILTEMTFTASTTFDGIGQVIVNGVTAPVVNGTVTVTGLNKEIVAGNQGTAVEVKAIYNNVTSDGQGGVATGKDVKLTLTGYKYTVNGTTNTVSEKSIETASMRLVSAYPSVVNATVSNETEGTLTATAKTEVMRFTVTATGNNGVNLKTIGLKANYDYNCGASSSRKVYIEDASVSGTNLAASSAVYGATTGTSSVITLDNAVEISAGQTKTFVVFVDNSGTTATGNYFRMDMVNAGWTWNDSTITGYTIDGTHIKEFTGKTFKK